jgi:multiple sugar transport system permease protein
MSGLDEALWSSRNRRLARAKSTTSRTRRPSRARRALLSAVPYLLPAVLLLVVFRIYPVFSGMWLSVTDHGAWLGFDRYLVMLKDPTLFRALLNNLLFVVILPFWFLIPLVIAVLIHGRIWLWRFFMAIFFLPALLSPVLLGIYYSLLLGYNGPVNGVLRAIGLDSLAVGWLVEPATAMPVVVAVYVWSNVGVGVLFFVSALGGIDRELSEAALLDGCSWFQRFWHVILPQLRHVLEFYATVTVIGIFTALLPLISMLTSGGPANSTMVVDLYIFQTAFSFNAPEYATAMGMVVFLVAVAMVLIQLRLLNRLVKS